MQKPFSKYSGCGNDFIFFDNRIPFFPTHDKKLITHLCHRRSGIGADGVILLENSSKADFRMRIFNADGSEAEMCGNGIRCLYKFINELGNKKNRYSIETMQRLLTIAGDKDDVTVEMGNPTDTQWNFTIPNKSYSQKMHYINTGVPHLVLFYNAIADLDMHSIGQELRHHPHFAPKGTNVNAAQVNTNELIHIRTYERGVEAETGACGTGVTAVALAAAHIHNIPSPIQLQTASQEFLSVNFTKKNNSFENVTLTGPANLSFHGVINLK